MPKQKSTSQSKQTRLGFTNQKRTGSTTTKKSPVVTKKPARNDRDSPLESSDEDEQELIEVSEPSEPTAPTNKGKGKAKFDDDIPSDYEENNFRRGKRKGKASTLKTHGSKKAVDAQPIASVFPIHAEGQTPEHQILRVFDLTYDYGPCVGIKRMDRWKRAEAMGLNPPREVFDILCANEGDDYANDVFYNLL